MKPFWSRVIKGDAGACWNWTGTIAAGRDGYEYGSYKNPETGRRISAHRFSYMQSGGIIPPGHIVHHRCENTRCVNPSHLEAMSQASHIAIHVVKPCQHGNPKTYCMACKAIRRARWGRPRRNKEKEVQ